MDMNLIIAIFNCIAFFIATATFLYLAVNTTNSKIKIVDNRWTFVFLTILILPSVLDGVRQFVVGGWGNLTSWLIVISFIFMLLITAVSFHQKGLLVLNADDKALLNWVSKNLSHHKPKLTSKKEKSFLLKEISVILRFNVIFNIAFMVIKPSTDERNNSVINGVVEELKDKLEGDKHLEKSPLFVVFLILFFLTLLITISWAMQIFIA
ncbi:hypothetical protein PRVXT_000741 [Proteinivorax tanatarense]|uniref:Uncharacterized protein n=1 Tax=Proteinivorax tanatarense TaxID=1260629 RepID=A0AAU7VNR8_9FIRM